MNGTTLVSLAMLKVNSDVRGTDYLEYLVPFVIECIGAMDRPEFTADDVKPLLHSLVGLSIPKSTIEIVLQRLAKRRMLSRERKQYTKRDDQDFHSSLSLGRTEALRRENVVVNALVLFAGTKGVTWSVEKASEAFLQYLNSFSIECLRTYAQGTALPDIKEGSRSLELYLVNAFLRHAHGTSVELFEHAMVLVKGHMLANALICPDLSATKQKFTGVTFYLDTRLALDAAGLHGAESEAAALELIELLKHLKASIAVFEHTFLEMDGVIRFAEARYSDPDARVTVLVEAKRAGRTRSDLTLERARLDSNLAEIGIAKRAAPAHEKFSQIDEVALEKALRDGLNYQYEGAARHDVECVRSIYTLRRRSAPTRLENSSAALVTTNARFAHVAYAFGNSHESSREVSTVLTNFSLANIAWLKAPLGAPDLPRLEVLANCYAAMEPPLHVWRKYVDEIDRLKKAGRISAEDHEILRFSLQARDELMDRMLVDGEQVSAMTVEQVMGHVKAEMVKEKDATIERQSAEIVAGAEKAVGITAERDRLRSKQAARVKRAYWIAETFAKWTASVLFFGIGTILVLAALAWPLDRMLSRLDLSVPAKLALTLVAGGVVAAMAIGGGLWGWSASGVASATRARLQPLIFRLLLKAMMEDPEDAERLTVQPGTTN